MHNLPPGNGTFFKFSYDVSTFLRLYDLQKIKKVIIIYEKLFLLRL